MKFINNKTAKKIFVVGVLVLGFLTVNISDNGIMKSAGAVTDEEALYYANNEQYGYLGMTTGDQVRLSMAMHNTSTLALSVNDMAGVFGTYGSYLKATTNGQNSSHITPDQVAGTITVNTILRKLNVDVSTDIKDQNLIDLKNSIYQSVMSVLSDQECIENMKNVHNISQIYGSQNNYELITGCVKRVTDNSANAFAEYYKKTTSDPVKLKNRLQALDNQQSGNQKALAAAPGGNEEIYCIKWLGGVSIPGCIAILSYFILYLTSWVLFAAALLFDFTISYTLSMTDIIDGFTSIQYGWEVFRNLINLFFILILVFISISTILQVDSYGYKKLLGKLVIAAILINFSMFFTKVIIDASNITALVFYKQIMVDANKKNIDTPKAGDNVVSSALTSASEAAGEYNNLSMGIMDALGMQTIWGVSKTTGGGTTGGSTKDANNDPAIRSASAVAAAGGAGLGLNPWTMTLVGLGGSVFILFLSFIFLAASFMFLARTVMLIMLLVTSPIAFAANVLPQTKKLSDKWWSKLNSAVLFAPVYMLLMFVTLKMIWGRSDKVTNLLSMFSNTDSGAINSIFFFFLLCFLLVMCLTAAATIGTIGSKTMSSWGKSLGTKAKNFAINKATSPVSYLADKASKSSILSRLPGGGMILQGADKLAQSKLGGDSSYRSRVDADKKTYQTRGELIKKARTGDLIRRMGESDEEFNKRKKDQEGEGKKGQREYLGISTAKGDNRLVSSSFNKGKQMAMQEIMNKSLAAKTGAFVDIENKAKKDSFAALKQISEKLEEADEHGDHTEEALKFIEKIGKEGVESMDLKDLTKVIDGLSKPFNDLTEQIFQNNKEAHDLRNRRSDPSTPSTELIDIDNRLSAITTDNLTHRNRRDELRDIISLIEKPINRWQENDARSGTKAAIEENKPDKK
jgi:hypothetical protein